jgi:hypothetical protein
MGFRRDKEAARNWTTWLLRNRDDFLAAGVPDFVLNDEKRFHRFCGEGFDAESGFGTKLLTPEQRQLLRIFLIREFCECRLPNV